MKRRINTSICHNAATLHRIVRNGKKNKISEVLSKVDQEILKVPDGNGETVLHLVLANENLMEHEIIEFLTAFFLDRGTDVNAEDRRRKTVLRRAIQRRMKGVVDLLVSRGADIYKRDREGNSLAHEFVRDEHMQVGSGPSIEIEAESANFLEFLIAMGFDFDFPNEMDTSATQLAIELELEHISLVLVRHIRDVHVVDRSNKSLLHLLLEKRESRRKNWKTNTTRYFADIVKILLDRGLSSWSRDSVENRTSLQAAIECEEATNIIEMLVDYRLKDIDGHLATDTFAELLESCSWWDSRTEYFLEILCYLIARGADVNAKDKNGKTPTYHAIHGKNKPVARFLSLNGGDFCARNEEGENAYHAIADLGPFTNPIYDELLSAMFDFVAREGCCDVNARNSAEETPLHCAARRGNLAIAKKLIERGAEVDCKDVNGNTPLHLAVMHGQNEKLAELLLESGADVNGKDNQGRRPLSIAVDVSEKLVPLLLKRGAYVNAHNQADQPFRKVILRDNFRLAKEMLAYGADVNDEAVVDLLLTFSWDVPPYSSAGERSSRSFTPRWSNRELYYLSMVNILPGNESKAERQYLLQHWIRLRAARLPYSQKHEIYGYHQVHRECLKEIELMKDTFIDDCTSIYGFLHMDFGCRRRHVNSEKLRQLVQSPDLERQFPNYSVVILGGYRETVVWKSLLEPAKQGWLKLTGIRIPGECLEPIFAHLRNEDLVRMIEHEDGL